MKDDGIIATLSAFELCNVVDRKLADNVCTEQEQWRAARIVSTLTRHVIKLLPPSILPHSLSLLPRPRSLPALQGYLVHL